MEDSRHVAWLRSAVALALFFGLAHCPNLWTSDRTYPLTPVWNALPPLPPVLNRIWFDGLLGLTLALALWPRGWLAWVVVVVSGTLSLWDQSRWQPWFYQYWWMLVALGESSVSGWLGRSTEPGIASTVSTDTPLSPSRPSAHSHLGLNLCLLILGLTYFWSGLQKCNPAFFQTVYPWFIEKILPKLPAALQNLVEGAAWTVPLLEIVLGLGMLCRPVQWLALLGAMVMHLFILWCLGPWGHNWNTVVWPWNVAMILCCLILIGHAGKTSGRDLLWPRSRKHALILLLFGVMPFFSFIGLWDKYLSAALYSGNTLQAWVRVSAEASQNLPANLKGGLIPLQNGWSEVDTFSWSISELNVPPYPEPRIFRSMARQVRRFVGPLGKVELVILLGTDPATGERVYLREEVPP